jgi:hypothetical protein
MELFRFVFLSVMCWVLSPVNVFARKQYDIKSVDKAPVMDGELDDAIWLTLGVANEFTQTVPDVNQPSKYPTEVRLCYTSSAIYIAATMFQPISDGLRQFTARDMLYSINSDVFAVFIDPYDDHQNGFMFRVSSAGVQHDERLSNGAESGDIGWDAVWTSKVKVKEDRWQVEMEIPFSALRFSASDQMAWGVNFFRSLRKRNESSYWNPIDVQKQGFLAQSGVIQGFKHIHPPVRLFLFPYLSAGHLRQMNAGTAERQWLRSGGLDIKYGLNESFTLDATLIPDFSQVISDNVIRILSPFEQQLTENRPFFTEGTELFNKAGLFYSRRVGARPSGYYNVQQNYGDLSKYQIVRNPNITTLYNAFKFSGRTSDKLGIGVFNAIGSPMHATIEDVSTNQQFQVQSEPLTNYNMLVLDQALDGQSNINFTNTNVWRNGSARDANVSSLMVSKFNKAESYVFSAHSKVSVLQTDQSDIGSHLGFNVSKISGKVNFTLSADRLSPRYNRTDLGIQFDYNHATQVANIQYFENRPKVNFLQLYRIGLNQSWSQNAVPFVFKSYEVSAFYFMLFKNFWDVTLTTESRPVRPTDFYQLGAWGKRLKLYPYWYNSVNGSSDSRRKLFWSFNGGYGFTPSRHADYVYLQQGLRYRFSMMLDVQVSAHMTRDNGNIGFAFYDPILQEPVAGRRSVRQYTGEISFKLNLSPDINFTGRLRHYNSFIRNRSFHTVDSEGEWRGRMIPFRDGYDENYNLQNVDIFLNWMFRPGSRLVVSYKQWLNDAYLLNDRNGNQYFENVYQTIRVPHAYEVAVRLIYFLDYNALRTKYTRHE